MHIQPTIEYVLIIRALREAVVTSDRKQLNLSCLDFSAHMMMVPWPELTNVIAFFEVRP